MIVFFLLALQEVFSRPVWRWRGRSRRHHSDLRVCLCRFWVFGSLPRL